jgi:epoxyqueuosine reductase
MTTSDPHPNSRQSVDLDALASEIKGWGRELGFQKVGIADIDLPDDARYLHEWLERNHHGVMDYMSRHGEKRWQPEKLVPGTLRAISARMDYWPEAARDAEEVLGDSARAYVSRYALGRDYHKLMRARLAKLAARIETAIGPLGARVFVDSGPVLEKALARNAGLGWIGKHTNLIDRHDGSYFFLGEILVDLALPVDAEVSAHCGSCSACLDVCPTKAIIAPYKLDARRCISYLTIELRDAIPVEFRKAIGNRIYGCDDCQLFCPWNKYAKPTKEADFAPRHGLDKAQLVELFAWTEEDFLERTEGSAIRRIGYECWLRNIAVALGNAESSTAVTAALLSRSNHPSALVREHVAWALSQHCK